MKLLRRVYDFDQQSSSTSTMVYGTNANGTREVQITNSEENKSSTTKDEPKIEEKVNINNKEDIIEYDPTDSFYGRSTDKVDESHTFRSLEPELRSEQNETANLARRANNLESIFKGDHSLKENDMGDNINEEVITEDVKNPEESTLSQSCATGIQEGVLEDNGIAIINPAEEGFEDEFDKLAQLPEYPIEDPIETIYPENENEDEFDQLLESRI